MRTRNFSHGRFFDFEDKVSKTITYYECMTCESNLDECEDLQGCGAGNWKKTVKSEDVCVNASYDGNCDCERQGGECTFMVMYGGMMYNSLIHPLTNMQFTKSSQSTTEMHIYTAPGTVMEITEEGAMITLTQDAVRSRTIEIVWGGQEELAAKLTLNLYNFLIA